MKIDYKKDRKIPINEYFFHSLNEKSAYWLGFLGADGNVYKRTINLTMSKKDFSHLLKYRSDLQTIKNFGKRKKILNNKEFISYCLDFNSLITVEELKKYNIVPNKTKIFKFPSNIDEKYENIYCRGYVDGDGCWRLKKHLNCSPQLIFELAGTEDFLFSFNAILSKNLGFDINKKFYKANGIYILNYSGNKICGKIAKWLYQDILNGEDNRYLERKFEIVKPFII